MRYCLVPAAQFLLKVKYRPCLRWRQFPFQTLALPVHVKWQITLRGHCTQNVFESNAVNLFFFCADLKTMSERLKNRYYVSKKLFMADLQRVFTNCREYNPPESEYYKCANILEKFFYTKIKEAGLIDKWHWLFYNQIACLCYGQGEPFFIWVVGLLRNFCLILSTFKNPFSFANMYYTEVTKIILLKCFIMYLITEYFFCVPITLCS